jgi:hypothetical protein
LSLERVLEQSMMTVPECVAAAYVDMTTGLLLAVSYLGNFSQDHFEYVAAKTGDIFQGPGITALENQVRQWRKQPNDNRHYIQEIIIVSDNQLHVFMRCRRNTDHAIVFITRKSAAVGMVIAKTRNSMEALENAV